MTADLAKMNTTNKERSNEMAELESHLKIALDSIKCFTDDGTLDLGEVNYLLGLAMADNVIDDNEKRVLGNIFDKVTKNDVSEKVWERIVEIRKKHQL